MKRIRFIDISKFIAIFLIALGHTIVHSSNCSIIFKFLYSFHVFLFFILSGYTFNIKKEKTVIQFIWKKFKRIMVPYFIWAILFLIPYMFFGNSINSSLGTNASFNLNNQIFNILYGNGNLSSLKQNTSLWFLPALFSMEITYYFIIKIINRFNVNKIIMGISLLIISYLSYYFLKIYLPWGVNTVLNIGVIFYCGYLLKEYDLLTKKRLFNLKYMILFLIIGFVAFYYNNFVSCVDYNYGYLSLALLSGFCLSMIVIYLSFKISESKLLEYIGQNTMGILVFHKIIILIFQTKMGFITRMLRNSNMMIEMCIGIIVVLISITFSLIATEIIRKLLPLSIGEDKKYMVK